MEACMVKPEVKKKPVKPKPPPKPAQLSQLKRNEQERLEQPAALRPPGPPKPPPKPPQLKRNEPERLEQPAPPKTDAETGELSSGKIFTEVVKTAEAASIEENVASLISDGSCNSDHWENSNEKGGFFSVFLPKSNKLHTGGKQKQDVEHLQTQTSDSENVSENDDINSTHSLHSELSDSLPDDELYDDELSTRGEPLNESQTKERGGIFSGIFRKSPRQTETTESAETKSMDTELLIGNNLTERKQKKSSGLFGKILKKTQKLSRQQTESLDSEEDETESSVMSTDELSEGSSTRVKKRGLAAIFQRSVSTEDVFEESKSSTDKKISSSWDNLLKATVLKEEKTAPPGILKKSPQPAPRSNKAEDLRSNKEDLPSSWDGPENSSEEKKVQFIGLFKKTPKTREPQNSDDMEELGGGELGCRRTIKRKKRVVSFRIRQTPPQIPKITSSSQTSDKTPIIEDNDEMRQSNPAEEGSIEVQSMEMAAYPTGDHPTEFEQEGDELMEWWNTAKGWTEWNEMSNIQEQDQEMAVEQAADRVYLAARVFVRLFNQRGGSLQRRILELLSLADAADHFHRKTVSAAVGGGVASVAGSVATITGLILAPFTFGASVIVTAVGISVATAGGITSATANITDTVHSRMDRKKVEKMIQGYQEEISDIRECLEFVQEGMDTLQEWDFERYSQQAAKKALNHNVKTVLRAGGSAGRALVINTEKLISTVQVLRAAGGAVKGARVVSVATGVMAALFLALDVFFLAKDSHELRKGAKTQFAAKIREVCKELQEGLLELNKVKTQLQKTMDGIEVEEYEEVQEVEVEIEDDLESDPKKLHELEQELDLLEEKLDKKVEEEQKKKKSKENERKKKEEEKKHKSKLEKCPEVEKGIQTQESVKSAVEALETEQEKHTQECRQERPLHDDRRVTDGKRGKRGEVSDTDELVITAPVGGGRVRQTGPVLRVGVKKTTGSERLQCFLLWCSGSGPVFLLPLCLCSFLGTDSCVGRPGHTLLRRIDGNKRHLISLGLQNEFQAQKINSSF
ncbi:uncharacterized protein LOC114845189 isoform X2 [Betta splendens]|uniref:Uncharacterized protein LOC114845189 isoform X2 n=1 Tax=Betta splendens TaxID=158456 RepID=A0A9W2XEF5_BETSP|nr:uncharacterized protein LOC114845189 isoform X2 [Betta splendens]